MTDLDIWTCMMNLVLTNSGKDEVNKVLVPLRVSLTVQFR